MRQVTRREFIRRAALSAVSAAVAACQPQTVIVEEEVTVVVKETVEVEKVVEQEVEVTKLVEKVVEVQLETVLDREAPQWVEMVAAGALPPLEERLPTDIEVVHPYEQIGVYGGSIRTVFAGAASQLRSVYGPEGLLRPDWDNETIIANFLQAWSQAEDGRSLTLHLRKGAKWSDGEPFAADNIMFWFEHDVLNGDLNPTPPALTCCSDGYVMAVERVDDHTVIWRYDAPTPFVGLRLAHADGVHHLHRMQAHYLSEFHVDLTERSTLDKAIADAKLETWVQLYNRMCANSYGMPQDEACSALPTLLPMRFATREDPVRIFERNPYYWKTDPDGNQLPYVDRVIATHVAGSDIADAMIGAGEVNYCPASVATLYSYPFYRQNEGPGHYVVRLYNSATSTDACYQPNHTVADPVLRQLYNDVHFKQALSLGIDRETINQVVYQGLGAPVQTHVVHKSRYHFPNYERAFIDYDPTAANDLLDQVGLGQRDDEGYRLRADGQRVTINITYCPLEPQHTANAEMVREMWEALDIQVTLNAIAADVLAERILANDIEFGIGHADRYTDLLFPFRPEWFVPCGLGGECCWGIEWARWYTTSGDAGQEPPNEIRNLFDIWHEMQATVDEYDQVFLGRQILRSQANNLWTIGTVGHLPAPIIVGDNMLNVPTTGWTGYDYLDTYPYHSEQFFFEGRRWSNEPE